MSTDARGYPTIRGFTGEFEDSFGEEDNRKTLKGQVLFNYEASRRMILRNIQHLNDFIYDEVIS